jgi:hypothetical protein
MYHIIGTEEDMHSRHRAVPARLVPNWRTTAARSLDRRYNGGIFSGAHVEKLGRVVRVPSARTKDCSPERWRRRPRGGEASHQLDWLSASHA